MPETITTISPTTNKPILTRHGPTGDELARLPEAARAAFESYSRGTTLAQRQAIAAKAIDALEGRKDELAAELAEQMGRPIAYGAKEVSTACLRARYLLRISGEALKDREGDAEAGFKRYIRKVPVGVVLVLFAWNYPYLILVNSIIPALLAGNAVILKPSPQTPTIAEHFQKLFTDAGLPENVIQYFHSGQPADVEKLASSPLINLICFTGSVAGGLSVQKFASGRVVPVGLELGGKDPAYVRGDLNSDADVKWAAEEIVDGAIFNSGQSCCSIERVYVDESIYDKFVEAAKEVLKGQKMGDPADPKTTLGPVVSKKSKDTIEKHIKDALDKGAVDATPDIDDSAAPKDGNFVKPRLLTGANHEMIVMRDETFGPVIPVMKVPKGGDKEAIKLMNDSEFGLTASIWTKNEEEGEKLAQEVDAGTVFVNRADYPAPDLAWTGWKNSGKGVTLSPFGFDQFVKLKSVHIKQHPTS